MAHDNSNSISKDVEIRGTLKFGEELIFDGQINGTIESGGVLVIGENGVIEGDVHAKSVSIFGKVKGNVVVQERCELGLEAELVGDLVASRMTIAEGATFVGRSDVGPNRPELHKENPRPRR